MRRKYVNTRKSFTEKTCNFFTNIDGTELLEKLRDVIGLLARRKVCLSQEKQEKRSFVTTTKQQKSWVRKERFHQKMNFCQHG